MNQHELDEWEKLIAAADAFALSVYVGPADDVAEAKFDAALVLAGKPAGLVGRRVFLGDLATRHDDAEWKAARLAAFARCLSREMEVRRAMATLVDEASVSATVATAVGVAVLSAADELSGRGGIDRDVLRQFICNDEIRTPEGIRLVARRCLGDISADLRFAAKAFDQGLVTSEEFGIMVAEATEGLAALASVAEDELDLSEVSAVVDANIVAAIADADCTRLTVLARLQARLVGRPIAVELQEQIDVCLAARDASTVAAFRAALDF